MTTKTATIKQYTDEDLNRIAAQTRRWAAEARQIDPKAGATDELLASLADEVVERRVAFVKRARHVDVHLAAAVQGVQFGHAREIRGDLLQ